MNYGVAGALFLGILIVWTAATAPDIPVGPMLVVGLAVTAAAILLFYPFSKTLWAAVDLLLHRMDRRDRDASRTTSAACRRIVSPVGPPPRSACR